MIQYISSTQLCGVVCCAYCVVVQTSMQFNSTPSPLALPPPPFDPFNLHGNDQGPPPPTQQKDANQQQPPRPPGPPPPFPPPPGGFGYPPPPPPGIRQYRDYCQIYVCRINVAGYFCGWKFREMLDKAVRTNFHGRTNFQSIHKQHQHHSSLIPETYRCIILAGHAPPVCLPFIYLTSRHVTRPPRPSPPYLHTASNQRLWPGTKATWLAWTIEAEFSTIGEMCFMRGYHTYINIYQCQRTNKQINVRMATVPVHLLTRVTILASPLCHLCLVLQ